MHATVAVDHAFARIGVHARGPHVVPTAIERIGPRVAIAGCIYQNFAVPDRGQFFAEDFLRAPDRSFLEITQPPIELDPRTPSASRSVVSVTRLSGNGVGSTTVSSVKPRRRNGRFNFSPNARMKMCGK